MLTRRTNVLFSESDYFLLNQLSKEKKTTVGSLVRQAVKQVYVEKKRSRAAVLRSIERMRKYINTKGINYRELIEDGRKY